MRILLIILTTSFCILGLGGKSQSFSQLVLDADSCFQNRDYTSAIINYEKARGFNSGHFGLNRNLTAAYKNTSNSANIIFIAEINSHISKIFNPQFKDLYSLLSYILFSFSILLIYRRVSLNKGPKWYPVVYSFTFVVIAITSITFLRENELAIVTQEESLIFESSTKTAKVITSVNSGYKLEILEAFKEWSKIRLPTNQVGWIQNKEFEAI